MNLNHITDEVLLSDIKKIASQVTTLTLQLLYHLQEIDQRAAYSLLNYPTLFSYCRFELGFSEQESWARISAMRTLGKVKGVEEKIIKNQLTLTQVGQLGSFLNKNPQEAKDEKKTNQILEMIEGKSTRETKKILDEQSGNNKEEEMVQIKISRGLYEKIRHLKGQLNKYSDEEILLYLYEQSMKKLSESKKQKEEQNKEKDKKKGNDKIQKSEQANDDFFVKKPHQRYVPLKLKRKLWQKANHQCDFFSPLNGKRCHEKNQLQIHHLIPFAIGGETSEANMQLRCPIHNFRAGVEFFGKNKMNRFRKT